jgi:isocitrate lyase
VRYLAAWLDGLGCVPIHHLMEDAATAEISRAQLWQWLHRRRPTVLDDGTPLDRAVRWPARRSTSRLPAAACPAGASTRPSQLLGEFTTPSELADFLTLPCLRTTSPEPRITGAQDARPCRTGRDPVTQGRKHTPQERNDEDHAAPRRPAPPGLGQQPALGRHHRAYSAEDVVRLRGTVHVEHSLARLGAEKLWKYAAHRALRQRARRDDRQPGDAAGQGRAQGDLPLAAGRSRPTPTSPARCIRTSRCIRRLGAAVVKRINNTLLRADQIHHAEGNDDIDFLQPIVADAEAGFGGVLNAFELMKAMIEAGAAGVHFEDQLASVKKCGHMGGKVLVPTREAVEKLVAARLAADVMGVPTLIVARTDAEAADLLTSDVDDNDKPFCTGERTVEGFFKTATGSTRRSAAAWPMRPTPIWSGAKPASRILEFARKFAEAIHAKFPGKLLAYNCSPSFNWKKNLDDATIARSSRRKSPRTATSSSSSPWPASTPQLLDVQPRARLRAPPDERLRRAAGSRIRRRRTRLHRGQAPARGRHRLLRQVTQTIQGGQSSTGPEGFDRGRAVPRVAAPGYPAAMQARAANVCLSVGYTLNPENGTPSDLTLLQAWSRDKDDVALTDGELEAFVQAAAGALSQWRFVPQGTGPSSM